MLSVVSCLTRSVVLFSPSSVLSFWGFILALQCPSAIHLGVDNLNVVHVSRILDGRVACGPFELTNDGDLLTIIEKMILQRGIRSCG